MFRKTAHLVEECIQHTDTKHPACSKREAEHECKIRALISLDLKKDHNKSSYATVKGQAVPLSVHTEKSSRQSYVWPYHACLVFNSLYTLAYLNMY